MIQSDALRHYADQLEAAGFVIYEATGRGPSNYFRYSRLVEGKECFGYVQAGHFGGFSHTMPIRPSIENGSSMFVDGVPDSTPDQGNRFDDPLTIEAAQQVAQLYNRNPLVGTQQNYDEPRFSHMYRRRDEAVSNG